MNVIEKATQLGRKAARYKKLEKIDYELFRQTEIVQILISACMEKRYIQSESERDELIKLARDMVSGEMVYLIKELDQELNPE